MSDSPVSGGEEYADDYDDDYEDDDEEEGEMELSPGEDEFNAPAAIVEDDDQDEKDDDEDEDQDEDEEEGGEELSIEDRAFILAKEMRDEHNFVDALIVLYRLYDRLPIEQIANEFLSTKQVCPLAGIYTHPSYIHAEKYSFEHACTHHSYIRTNIYICMHIYIHSYVHVYAPL